MNLQAFVLLAQVTLVVTNTEDSGSGSLRAAIEATYGCRPSCRIVFNIPGPGPWHTIRPERPLPPLLNVTTIDGTAQTRFGGDTNPLGPEVELSGALLREGHGLHLCGGTVTGLVINGFPGNGLVLGGAHCERVSTLRGGSVSGNYIGTDPTGTKAVPNTRGIWVTDWLQNWVFQYSWRIHDNVISGNRHSGVWIQNGPARVANNVIGLNAKHDAPLGNGASGVAVMLEGRGSDVVDNYIGFNHHFGIGLHPAVENVAVAGNSFQANGGLAIDYGFDGASPAGAKGVPPIPVILQARYENGFTIIESAVPQDPFTWLVYYASDAPDPSGYGEGQYVLGRGGPSFRMEGDLRGKWITATATRGFYWALRDQPRTNSDYAGFASATSEFSRAVEVK